MKPGKTLLGYGYPEVSIHTRHHWRVKLYAGTSKSFSAEFQSTPAITGG